MSDSISSAARRAETINEGPRVLIFDTTLRDGEQCPGASMNLREKLEVARQLERLKVDVIEAGFPVISDGDFEAVQTIARELTTPIICGLARCVPKDIDAAGAAVQPAGDRGRIHLFLATSKIHREFKLRKAEDEIVRLAVESVRRAKALVDDVEFSPEDASRTEPEFLARIVEAVIAEGATTVNIPDTTGFAMPEQYADLMRYLKTHVPNIHRAVISVHCHNDLGLAVANSVAAAKAGARQIECTVNGIGERAGNAALEEIVMTLATRQDYFGLTTGVATREIVKSSRLVSRASSFLVQRNKAIVGENAFAHGSGIHQDGILKKRETYEIMDPEEVGWGGTELPLTKHSGRNAMAQRLEQLGYRLTPEEIEGLFKRFKDIGDRKKFVYDDDLAALVDDSLTSGTRENYELDYIHVTTGNNMVPTATIRLRRGEETLEDSAPGNGAVDAAMKTIDRLLNKRGHLDEYHVTATTKGKDALGEVSLKADFGHGQVISGKGASTDVVEASARAYLNAVNRMFAIDAAQERAAVSSHEEVAATP